MSQEYKSEVTSYERTSLRSVRNLTEIEGDYSELAIKQKRLKHQILTEEDKFSQKIEENIFALLNDESFSKIKSNLEENDSNKISEIIPSLTKNIKYLNALAFILAYIITDKGSNEINKTKTKKMFEWLKNKREKQSYTDVVEADIIRYAKYIISLNL